MGLFGNKKDKTPKEALDDASKTLNTGVTGFMTKTFMGKGFTDKMNSAINQGQAAINTTGQADWAASGLPGTAEVMSIEDTGMLINFNPVVKMNLKVSPAYGVAYETVAQTMVSKIAIPRVGDKINIKYNPANNSQIMVL